MILWNKSIKLQAGGTLEIILKGNDPLEFWDTREGELILSLNKLVKQFEKSSLPPVAAKQKEEMEGPK
jgi:hypothetical protein